MTYAMSGDIIQVGYLVEDVDASVQEWIDHFGVGPWLRFEDLPLVGTFDGEPAEVRIKVAFSYRGELQVELIELLSPDVPSQYLREDGTPFIGAHHVAWLTDDLDADIAAAEERGLRARFVGGAGTMRVAYLDSPDQPGTWFELIESSMRPMLDEGIATSRAWDGTDPVRTVQPAG
ncbi:VOC family protein [Enemella sp. A6]|uniref:VOC family protein n=1 Tax=Enemella sp. A6 TaxID=3440152 RepID=UPI003EBE4A9C